ncbi:acyl carrier protein [Paenibacillus massiliensis]|uniref:acyl carrier protein n=1 Tax=Paenibacillus massiliensis TaxID=225917 RepID=UPI00035DB570|nr:phosphopantetheine-binding protein [Paenibacillus massiliensis]
MSHNEEMVIRIVQDVVLKLYKDKVTLQSKLRDHLGIDSINMIAIAAHLKEEGYDVISVSGEYDFATVETVKDIVDIINEMQPQV